MAYCVCKIGGSNLKSPSGVNSVLKVLSAYKAPLVVVVSAFYGVTDNLCEVAICKQRGGVEADLFLRKLKRLKFVVAQEYISDPKLFYEFENCIEARFRKIEYLLRGAEYIGETPPFLYDEIVSYGERLSSLLLTYLLRQQGVEAHEALPEDMGLYTDGAYGNASVDIASSKKHVKEFFSDKGVYVVPGFYGISSRKKVTLLGRGGSDYTASAIAACLQADKVDLWKDVSGFCSADPKVVKQATIIPQLTYDEAAELAYFGSKILHPRTVEPLQESAIPLYIRPVYASAADLCTCISDENNESTVGIKSITSTDDVAIIELQGNGVGMKPGILAKVTTELELKGLNIKSVYTSQTAIHLLIDKGLLSQAQKVLAEISWTSVAKVNYREDIVLVAAVGKGLTKTHGIAGMLFDAAGRAKINIQAIIFGASKVAVYFVVHRKDRDAIVREVHDVFTMTPRSDDANYRPREVGFMCNKGDLQEKLS